VLGGAVDVALRTLLITWDPVWRPGPVGWLVAVLEAVGLLVALVAARRGLHADPAPVGRVGMLGGYLALSLLIFGSPGYVASSSGLSLGYACAVLLVGALVAIEALSRVALPGSSGRWPDRYGVVSAFLLVAGVTVALLGTGIAVAVAVVTTQIGAALVLARGLAAAAVPEEAYLDDAVTDPAERRAAEKLDRVAALELDQKQDAEPVPDPDEPPAPDLADATPDELRDLALTRRRERRSAVGFGVAGLLTGLSFVLVVLLYQVHYEKPLPFPNQAVPIAAAVLLGALALGRRLWMPPADPPVATDQSAAWRGAFAPLAVLPAILVLAPVLVLVTAPVPATPPVREAPPSPGPRGTSPTPGGASETPGSREVPPATDPDRFRLVSWNVHYLRNADGVIDPEAVARAIERQRPDVVLLQEVSRGWPIGGTLDGVEWLSRRLAMRYVYAPAADRQFGNVILSRLRITAADVGELPQGEGTMRRSYAAASVQLPGGRTVRLYDVHLAHRDQDTPTRLAQLAALLTAWDSRSAAVIAGDFNASPGSVEIAEMTDAGLVSAQDATGNGGLLTSPTDRPRYRIDWIFGTPDVAFEHFVRPAVRTSDHFPLAVTVHLG
jgi:endonuclease/exonuclease/phosphatase family metal-dependent hydrolase